MVKENVAWCYNALLVSRFEGSIFGGEEQQPPGSHELRDVRYDKAPFEVVRKGKWQQYR